MRENAPMRQLTASRLGCTALLVASLNACAGSTSGTDAAAADALGVDGADGLDSLSDAVDASFDTPGDTRMEDAAGDAVAVDTPDAPAVDLACLGASLPITLSHNLPFAAVTVGSSSTPPSGLFLLDVATTASAIDLSAFGAMAPAASGCNPALLGQSCGFANLGFFGPWGSVTLITENLSGLGGGVTEAGILGTDFLSTLALTVDYRSSVVRRASTLCSDSVLSSAGLAPLSVQGFYANNLSLLRPLHDVNSAASTGVTVPNVPTVPIRLGGTAALAQLDTGFDDAVASPAININVALFNAIQATNPGALVRDAARDLSLSTCVVGVSEPVEAYDLASGSTLDFVATDATTAASFATAFVFVKRTPAAAQSCGGIGTWSAPAGQIAVSFFRALGVLVFDPFTSRVWIATH